MNIALIGIAGWGREVLDAIRSMQTHGDIRLIAAADIRMDQATETAGELSANGVVCYRDYREMLFREKDADIVAIATPIHLHRQMSIDAMEAGFHVFLEKPPAVTIQDVDSIIAAAERTGKHCAVDFLLSASEEFIELKQRISLGELGHIKAITGVGLWKRLDSYYERSGWAGKLVYNGNYVLDGTVNNPLSHLLNNMILLAQAAPNKPSSVWSVTAELYHAHNIESEDTSCVRVRLGNDIVMHFYATLCNVVSDTPYILVEGTGGTARWDYQRHLSIMTPKGNVIIDGSKDYPARSLNSGVCRMIQNLCDVVSGSEAELHCSVADTRSFVLASNGAFLSSGGIHTIGGGYVERTEEEGSMATVVTGIGEAVLHAAQQKKLFSETGIEWAVAGNEIDMESFACFHLPGLV